MATQLAGKLPNKKGNKMSKIDTQTHAINLSEELLLDLYVPVLTSEHYYITNGTEIANIASRRELEALLRRQGQFRPAQHLTKPEAADLSSALVVKGIHMDQWLKDRNYTYDLDALDDLLVDFAKHGDCKDNDTRLRVLVLDLVKKHQVELVKTYLQTPADTSIHGVRIMNHMASKNSPQATVPVV